MNSKNIIRLAIAAAVCALSSSCTGGSSEVEFINSTKEASTMLMVGNATVFNFNEDLHQLAYTTGSTYQFRAYDDSFTKYFILTLYSNPTKLRMGDLVSGTLTYTGLTGNITTKDLVFRVSRLRTDGNRVLSLWNEENRTGVIVKVLK